MSPAGGVGRSAYVVEGAALGALNEHPEQLPLADALGQRLGTATAQEAIRPVTAEGKLPFGRSVNDCARPRSFLDDA
jgi:hypothetical protein